MSPLDHDAARKLMAEGVDGRLNAADERELALHLVGCTECKRLYDGLQQAHPALASIGISSPPTRAVDAAVRRASSVLRGDADPGPLTTAPAAASASPPSDWAKDTGPLLAEDDVEKAGSVEEPEVAEPAEKGPPSDAEFAPTSLPLPRLPEEAISAETKARPEPPPPAPSPPPPPPPARPVAIPRHEPPTAVPPPPQRPRESPPPLPVEPPSPRPTQPPATAPPSPASPPTTARPDEPPIRSTGPMTSPMPTRISSATVPPPPSRPDEVEALLDEDYGAEPVGIGGRPRPERSPVGAGPWLAAIAVTIALAVLAAVLLTRGSGILGTGGDLPTAEEVRTRIERVFGDMKSLKASFTIRRLSLYRTGGDQGSLAYAFANGEYAGRIVYDREEGYRQEVTLNVSDREVDRAKIVQTGGETKSLIGTGGGLLMEKRPPLGPPDGQLRPALGVLEQSIGTAVQALLTSDDIDVVGTTKSDGRELYQVRTPVTPDELSRADEIEFFLDSQTFFPAIVRRSISRVDAGVLGPGNVLTEEAISTAFGDRERITTELVELDNYVRDDIVLPGEFVLDAPSGSQSQSRDAQFERVTRAQVGGKLPFKPLFPRSLPEGFEEQSIAVFTGEQHGWGPGNRYSAPDGVMHASYFDGHRTIVVTERNIPSGPFTIDGSPLQAAGLPVTVRSFDRAEKRFFFGVSPEVPPHAYGFLGNTFAMVSGYATASELIDILASLGEAPVEVPAAGSPSPGATSSPGAAATASPAASPGSTLPGEGSP